MKVKHISHPRKFPFPYTVSWLSRLNDEIVSVQLENMWDVSRAKEFIETRSTFKQWITDWSKIERLLNGKY